MSIWKPIETAPDGVWLRTKRKGEKGENVCRLRVWPDGDREWIEIYTGRTTVTHGSFAPPTHWAPLLEPREDEV